MLVVSAGCAGLPSYPTLLPKCGSAAAPPTHYDHIVVIMEENRTWSLVGGVGFGDPFMPFLHDAGSRLGQRFGIHHATLQIEVASTGAACALAPAHVV